jgi:VanZ family protein
VIISRERADRLYRLAYAVAATSLLVTCIGTLLPGKDLPPNLPPDTLLHSVGFGVPTLLAAFAASGRRRLLILVLGIAATATSMELLQYFVPDRTVELHDLASNALGITVGCALGRLARAAVQGV